MKHIDIIDIMANLWAIVVIVFLTMILFAELFGIYFVIRYIIKVLGG